MRRRAPQISALPIRRLAALAAVSALVGGLVAACAGSSGSVTPAASGRAQAASVVASGPATASAVASPPQSVALRDLAGSRYFGSAVSMPQLTADPAYADLARGQFSQVTPENAMKWALVEPTRGQFTWDDADSIVAFAQAHGQKVRGHTLLWHNQLPDWLTGGNYDKKQLSAILQQHIAAEAGRYAGKIYAWDVVNEAIADDGSMRPSMWLATIGPEYIADAFKWAHAADPAAKLYINDYNVEGVNAKSDALYELVRTLKSQGVPIDGVGFQAHFDIQNPFPADFADNMKRFAALGVEVAVTELDVRITLPSTANELTRQADYYGRTVAACLAVPQCVGVTVWEFTDRQSWVPAVFPGEGEADLWDANLNPKPAVAAVAAALSGK
jgi:endo-1,4-beta-xylanase